MRLTRLVVPIYSFVLMVLGAGVVYGQQNYPSRPIRIVTVTAGGTGDFVVRLIVPALTASLGQPVIVENRSGSLPAETVSRALPDGYTMLVDASSFWLDTLLRAAPSYDLVKDFPPVTLLTRSPLLLVVYPSLPAKSVKELIALAKARPGELNVAAGSSIGAQTLAAELFTALTGANIVRIGYKGSAPALSAVIAGEVQMMFTNSSGAAPHAKSGKLRALAVTSAQPSALFPDLPMVAATVPGYQAEQFTAMFAPTNTPAALISRLNQEIVQALNRAEVKERLFNAGLEAVGSSPQDLAATIKFDLALWGKVIKDAGIKVE